MTTKLRARSTPCFHYEERLRSSHARSGVRIDMEVDTGASASIISEDTYREIAAHSAMEPLQESTLKLTTYTGESISLAGSTSVAVRYGHREETLVLHVVAGRGPSLMGRDWLSNVCLHWGYQ